MKVFCWLKSENEDSSDGLHFTSPNSDIYEIVGRDGEMAWLKNTTGEKKLVKFSDIRLYDIPPFDSQLLVCFNNYNEKLHYQNKKLKGVEFGKTYQVAGITSGKNFKIFSELNGSVTEYSNLRFMTVEQWESIPDVNESKPNKSNLRITKAYNFKIKREVSIDCIQAAIDDLQKLLSLVDIMESSQKKFIEAKALIDKYEEN